MGTCPGHANARRVGGLPIQSPGSSLGKKDYQNSNRRGLKNINKTNNVNKHINNPKNKINKNKNSVNNVNNSDVTLSKLQVFYTNADQLKNKLNELNTRLAKSLPDIIGITEVKNKNNFQNIKTAEYTLDVSNNYNIFQKNVENDSGRGLLMYINKLLDASEEKMNTTFEENLFIRIPLTKQDKLLIGLIYRSPSIKDQEHANKLRELIQECSNKNFSHVLLMGDFNYPNINWSNWTSKINSQDNDELKFIETIQDNALVQHILEPTRWRGTDTPHVLDLIITNEKNMVEIWNI